MCEKKIQVQQENPLKFTYCLRLLSLPHKCRAPSFFSIFFHMPQRLAKLKQELSLDHLQRPIARCGPIQGDIDKSPK
jgi:hypothetical protein